MRNTTFIPFVSRHNLFLILLFKDCSELFVGYALSLFETLTEKTIPESSCETVYDEMAEHFQGSKELDQVEHLQRKMEQIYLVLSVLHEYLLLRCSDGEF
jgi:hypothetical protein